tara:strand:+ start:5979 stop:6440 length:462 start_codon:yes stop_codon:yes gene_type:complete
MTVNVVKISFDEIKEIWSNELWPGRTDVNPFSTMLPYGGNDIDMDKIASPIFIAIMHDDFLAGVNSVHYTGHGMARSRGLYVRPDYRGKGYGVALLNESKKTARDEYNAEYLWSLPKKSGWKTYSAADFVKYSDWLSGFEYGPNAYAMAKLSD